MSRVRLALVTALAGIAALTACSSSSDGPDSDSGTKGGDKPAAAAAVKPVTEELTQAQLTQALPGDGEMLPGWTLHGDKDVTDGPYCNRSDDDSTPAGWIRGGDSSYEYDGSTNNMAHVHICLFDSEESAHHAYTEWKGTETSKEQAPKPSVGDESTLVINPGASEDTVYGFARSGRANIRVRIEGGTGDDPSGAQATLSATLKRLQQLQDNKAATVRAPDELVTATN
ncbi:hypothetical protein B046DRAFT_04259 [Streptomyces sp. LamerLS-316]|uniref:hypothetical protein n=1 Tax=unclassified Streptomyces TaxID=2593676 RepID=UPI000823E8D1|nr:MULTISPECIES: hypothetical protein [unclassified Streptomyces]MYQ39479.1 hypothetical protein [Streptomyces sp. SID4921]SCK43237.1 hypothetical protein B046DRAFT_04259 [Streptomyces sp. LamerLS-316]